MKEKLLRPVRGWVQKGETRGVLSPDGERRIPSNQESQRSSWKVSTEGGVSACIHTYEANFLGLE